MATASKLQHHVYSDVALPYVSNSSPLSADPQYIQGSSDVLTSVRGYAEKRPGFSQTLETVASTFVNLKTQFVFEKWDGQFYAMFCDLDGTAKVYKYAIGVDSSAVLIYTSASAEPFDFCFSNNTCYFGNGVDNNKKFLASSTSDTNVYNMGIATPSAPSSSLGAGTLDAQTGYQYRITGVNSTTGGESSCSDVSSCTGTFTNQDVTVTWTDPSDTQCDFVNIYRTTDGGSNDPTQMYKIAQVARGVQTYTDSTQDTALGVETGPALNYNDPMPPVKGMVWSQGRIWGFTNATTWYSGYEEITNGVPEETCPGGTLGIYGGGNNYNWPKKVGAHAPLPDGVAVYLNTDIWKIEGDSLDTFRRYVLVQKRGAKYQRCVTTLGSSTMWFDTSGQVWLSDLGEIGLDIRPETAVMDQSQVSVAIHISGNYHWACVLDGANGKLYVYDLDKRRWMPPWNVGTTASALCSGEIADGTIALMLARNKTKVMKLVADTYTDDGSAYAGALKTGMLWIASNSQVLEYYDRANPEWRGVVDNVEIKTDSVAPTTVSQMNDDNPAYGTYTAITRVDDELLDVPQGSYIKINRYKAAPATKVGRMTSIYAQWTAANSAFRVYTLDIAYEQRGQ